MVVVVYGMLKSYISHMGQLLVNVHASGSDEIRERALCGLKSFHVSANIVGQENMKLT